MRSAWLLILAGGAMPVTPEDSLTGALHRCATQKVCAPIEYPVRPGKGFRRVVYDSVGLGHWIEVDFRAIQDVLVENRKVHVRGAFAMGTSGATLGMLADQVTILAPDEETARSIAGALESLRGR